MKLSFYSFGSFARRVVVGFGSDVARARGGWMDLITRDRSIEPSRPP